ncbi:MAG TPA: S9 family peptidase [Bacteroidota bacterium]|nr:S9 family peptidase [Bacteroidota bacterium]
MLNKIKTVFLFLICLFILNSCSNNKQETYKIPEINRQQHNLNSQDLFSFQRISESTVSPDGKWVAFIVATPSIEDNKIYSDLWAMNLETNELIQITNDKFSESNPTWSPDCKKLAYISNKESTPQAYVMEFPKGATKKITYAKNGISNLLWSPDGKFIIYSSDVKMKDGVEDQYPNLPKANVRIYDQLPVRHWDEWEDNMYNHLFISRANGEPFGDGSKAIDLTPNIKFDVPMKPYGGREELAFSPDGKEIAYTAKFDSAYVFSTNSDIIITRPDLTEFSMKAFFVKVEKTQLKYAGEKNITDGMMGYDKDPMYSPDGKWIAFKSQERAGFESDRIRLMLYNRETEQITELTKNFDQWVDEAVWSPDSKKIYLTATDSGSYGLFEFQIADNSYRRLSQRNWNYGSGLAITPDGSKLIFGKQNSNHPLELYTLEIGSLKEKQLTHFNDERLKYINPVKFEERWFTSPDGQKVQAWIFYPPNFDSTKKYPMITFLQGGPQSMTSPDFHYRWNFNLFASQGYVVIATNRRGSPGFGQAWVDAVSKDWGGKPMDDILACTDQFSQMPFIDKDHRAAIGASAGGYAAFWLEGHHQGRFKAFVAHCGAFDLISDYGSTDELWFPNWEYGGPYWDPAARPNYEKNSPHNYVQNWDTPILISTGEYDFRLPYTQSLEAFTAAQVKNIPSEILIYPNETHFISKPQDYLVWFDKVMKFLDKYCK